MTELKGLQTGLVAVEGANLHYEIAGEGPCLVLAHAGLVDSGMWDEQFSIFAQHYRVLRYDRRGFGKSSLMPGAFSHRGDLYQLLKFLGIRRAHLLGCSAGGAIVIDFVLEYPEMAASLILVSSALGGYEFRGDMPKPLMELMEAMRAIDLNRAADQAIQLWLAGPHRSPEQIDVRLRERVHAMSVTALPNFFVTEEALNPPAIQRLDQLTAPTLVMVGQLDDANIMAVADLLVAKSPHARKVVIPGAAHLPNLDKPEDFNQAVLTFLR